VRHIGIEQQRVPCLDLHLAAAIHDAPRPDST
jgi:hypothetical protein